MKLAVTLLFLSLMIFYTGCASTNKQKKRPKRPSDDTMSFFDDEPKKADTGLTGRKIIERFNKEEYEADPEKKLIKSGGKNPPWVSDNWQEPNDKLFISRRDHAYFSRTKTYHTVSDSLLRVLKVRVAQDIESRVYSEMVSAEEVNIKRKGKEEEYNHTTLIRDYAKITSNIILDPSFGSQEVWVDVARQTVYCMYRINRKKYEEKVQKKKEENANLAYANLKDANSIFDTSTPSVTTLLKKISTASYYISKGVGFEKRPDLVDPGKQNEVVIQKSELLDKIRNDFGEFRSIDDKIISHQKAIMVRIVIPPGEYLDYNGARLRVSFTGKDSKPSQLIEAPDDIPLNADGEVTLPLKLINDVPYEAWDDDITVRIDFNLQSDLIDKESYYESDEYEKLVSNFPSVSFKVTPTRFIKQKTWVLVAGELPYEFNKIYSNSSQDIQEILSRLLEQWGEIFDIIDPTDMNVDYKKAQAYRNGILKVMPERDLYLNHDLDAVVKVTRNQSGQYDVKVSLHSIDPQRTIKHTELSTSHRDSIESAIDKCLDHFMNEYFTFNLEIATDLDTEINKVMVDGKKIENLPENIEIGVPIPVSEPFSRFRSHDIVVYKEGFKPQKTKTELNMFSLSKPSKLERLYNFQLTNFAKPSGTLKVGIFERKTNDLVKIGKYPYDKNNYGPAPKIYLQKRLWIFPAGRKKVFKGDATLEHKITELGKYAVWARKAAYDPMKKKIITIFDDEELGSIEKNYLKIELDLKSPKYARGLSIIVPGSGQWYWVGKGWSMRKIPALSFFTAAAGSIYIGYTQYRAFGNEKNNYNNLRKQYLASNDPEQWENYDQLLSKSRERMEENKRNARLAIGSYGLVWSINVWKVTW